ncbi:MAG: signal peptidase I [Nocardioides sp.]
MISGDRDAASAQAPDGQTPDEPPVGTRADADEDKSLPLWQETILLLAIALGLAVLIKALLVQAFSIPSESMEPGLLVNDRILVQKVSYWGGGSPERGDVVVFKDPGGWLGPADSAGPTSLIARGMTKIGLYPTGGHLVKRVIGIEGDVITCCDAKGRISVNGMPMQEGGYVKDAKTKCNGPMTDTCEWSTGPIPEDRIFVMGDNRGRSADSTVHLCEDERTGCAPGEEFVPVDLVVGKVFVLLWPSDHFRWVTRPDSFADVPDSPGNE